VLTPVYALSPATLALALGPAETHALLTPPFPNAMRLSVTATLLAAALLLCPSLAASSLRWTDMVPTPCAEDGAPPAECKAGRCGFQACSTLTRCRGGGCLFVGCTAPTCDGGGCKFVDCTHPTCGGGACDFVNTETVLVDGFCSGGGCTIEGFAARHRTEGSAVF